MSSDFLTRSACERFLKKVEVRTDDECWNWKGTILRSGYGQFWDGVKKWRAHRLAYFWHYESVADDVLICHHCNNRLCCNPLHLFTGTPKDNISQCSREGRKTRGTDHHSNVITPEQVREIRRRADAGENAWTAMGREYDITGVMVKHIAARRRWAWLPDEPEETAS